MIDIYLLLLLVRSSMDALGPSLMKHTVLGAKPNNCLRVLGRTVLCNTVQYCTVMFACEILLPQSCCYSFARTASSCVRGLLNRTSCLLVYHRRVHITHFMTWITVIDGLQSSRMKYSQFPCAVLVLSCHWPSISEWSNANALQSSIFTYLPLSLCVCVCVFSGWPQQLFRNLISKFKHKTQESSNQIFAMPVYWHCTLLSHKLSVRTWGVPDFIRHLST